MARELLVLDLGTREYGDVHQLMLRLHELRVQGALPDALLLVQHPPVATLGRRGTRAQVFDATLPVFEVERGGQATYHGPGQLVAYPIVKLPEASLNVKQLVLALAEAAVEALAAVGVEARVGETKDLVGVWVGPKKIASIGLAVQRDVSFHGLALNVSTDLAGFARIQPCGMDATIMTSAEHVLGRAVPLEPVQEALIAALAKRLGAEPRAATERGLIERLKC